MNDLYPTIPNHSLSQYARIYSTLGFVPIPLRGKVPVLAKWQNLPGGEDEAVDRLQHHRGNVGLVLPDDLFVIDVDRKAGKDGLATLRGLESLYGELPQTLTQTTASGGLHYVFRKPPEVLLKNTVGRLGEGLDIRTRGGQIVAEPSLIDGNEYVWEDWDVLSGEVPEIADAPAWLLDSLTVPPKPALQLPSSSNSLSEGGRNQALFQLACSMRGRGTCSSAILEQLRHENASRCAPPLDDSEVLSIANSALRYAPGENPSDWPDPIPLIASIEPTPYPLDALPETLRAAVEEVLSFTKAPIPLVASSALAALSLAIQAHADIKRAERLQGPVGLFLLTIADSGERKSTCDGFFMQALRNYEANQAELAKPLLKDHRAALEAWGAQCSGIKAKINQLAKGGKSTHEQASWLCDLEHDKPEPPRVPRLIYGDATPEALKWNLAKGWPSGGVVSSEAGLVFGAHGMGKDSVMRNLATLNQLWDGMDIATERRTSESFTVRGARLTIALQIQEATLRSFFDRSGGLARGTGFMARFLISWPQSTQGMRLFTEAPSSWPALERFNRRITEILEREVTIGEDGALSPPLFSLSEEAKKQWVLFHDAIEQELATGGELFDVRDVASKTADNAARIATLFQIFEHGIGGAVEASSFEGASRIAAWHLQEARRFFGELVVPEEQIDAVRLDSWLIDYCRQYNTLIVPRREIQRHVTPGHLRQKINLDRALAELAECDRVRLVHYDRRKEIHINPALLRGEAV
jgi:hypothetical protein